MLNENIKAIVFDFFGVICREVHQSWFDENQDKFDLSIEEYKENSRKVDLGIINENQFIDFYAQKTKIDKEELTQKFDSYVVIDNGLVDFIRELKKEYKIGLISSAESDFIRNLMNKNNLENLFDSIVISSEVGLVKPNPEIYNISLRELSVLPEEAVFIDDRESNIIGARDAGIKTILYKDINDLKLKLGC